MALPSARGVALEALLRWRNGRQFADAVIQQLLRDNSLGESDRGFATELFYGVLRHLTLLDFWIDQLRSGALDHVSRDLLRLGFYQLFCLRTPGHAAVFETVELAGKKNRALINGVLRNALRNFDQLEKSAAVAPLPVQLSHPQFLIDRWIENFGHEAAIALCQWNNQPAPMYARINRLKISTPDFLSRYEKNETIDGKDNFVRVADIPSDALTHGHCYIQDPSTSLACELLDPQPGETILDACAAPGGKSALLAELMQNRGRLVACDRDARRLAILRSNLETLGVTCAQIAAQDWNAPTGEFAKESFDRILVDAPCSNTGVMRRRVDARWRLTPEDFLRMPNEQLRILRAVAPLLKPGGTIVYSTCSLEPEENEQVVAQLLREFPRLRQTTERSVRPFRDSFDGAFAARVEPARPRAGD